MTSVGVDATIGDARRAVRSSAIEAGPIVVLGSGDVVLGALHRTALQLPPTTRVEGVMQPSPGTIRPELRIAEVVRRLDDDHLAEVLVTGVDGVLVGRAVRADLHAEDAS